MNDIETILENIEVELEKRAYVESRNQEHNKALHDLIDETSIKLVDLIIKGASATKAAGSGVGMEFRGVEAELTLAIMLANKIKQKALIEMCSRLQFKKEEPQQ